MRKEWLWALGVAGAGFFPLAQAAEPGFYVGGSFGQSRIEKPFDVPLGGSVSIDENEDAWKIFAGARFGLLGLEGSYVNFGSPNVRVGGTHVDADVTGYDLFGVLNWDVGPTTLFAKAGAIAWDVNAKVNGVSRDDDGTDPAFGLGASFRLTDAFRVRAEYEMYDIGEFDNLNMWSAGIQYQF